MQKVVLVGCGFMGNMHGTVYGLLPNAEMVGAVDKDPVRLKEYCDKFGCRGYATLADAIGQENPDVIDVCLPTDLHAAFVVEAATHGKHVFCEKPMARTVEQAEAMTEVCRKNGVRLMLGHCIRFWPEYALLKQIVDDKRLGKLLSINLTRFGEFPSWSSENWLASEARSGGGVLDMHIHDTDYAHYILGKPDEMVSFGTVDDKGPSFVFTTMRFGQTVAHLEGGWNLPHFTPFKMAFRAIFERGAAIMDSGPMTIYEDGKEPVMPEFPKMEAQGGGNISDLGGYFVELKYFVDRLESGEPFEVVTPETSLESLRTALAEIGQIKARSAV
ncbi:MAG TPA: Gfo/Idh/MocA family oxidoreductase [Fimbriimonadaceae bacterium]|nr:Gfo/Idh/MocA family oxidoreductase [Fimbriimonadaceae bacterium]